MAFYVVRGYDLDKLVNMNSLEKLFLHHARDQYYREEVEKYKMLLGGENK